MGRVLARPRHHLRGRLFRTSAAVLLAGAALSASAQAQNDSVPRLPPVIQAIRFERHNVYAEREASHFLPRLVNRLHIRTQPGIIEREVLLDVGERYDSSRVAETARNLRSLGIFRRVDIDTTSDPASGLILTVETQDAWSTKPEFTFRTTGGQVAYRLSLIEENLFGTASRLSVSYSKDPDRDAVLFGFHQPKLVAGRIGLGLWYDDRSDGYIFDGWVSQPWLSLEARSAWTAGLGTRDERILRYVEGERVASDTVRRLLDRVDAGFSWAVRASQRGYVRLGLGGRIWRDDFLPADADRPSARLAYGAIGGSWEWRHARFVVVRGFRANREEDVDLSTTVRAGLSLTPTVFGFADDGVVPGVVLRTGGVIRKKAFGYVDLAAHGRFTGAGLDSGSVQTAATLVYLPSDRQVALFYAWGGWLENPRPGGEFDLGLGFGPRAYRLHAFTGDRAVFSTAEYRFMLAEDFLTIADIGVAGFLDWGGAWYSGSPRRTGWDFGIGLRVGTSRSTDLLMNRVDLAYRPGNDREPSGWVLVIGKGFVFSTSGLLRR